MRYILFALTVVWQSFQMLRELSAGITGQARPAGSLGQVATQTVAVPTSGDQDDEEEVVFETKTEGLSGKKYTITVNLTEGKLIFKKQGIYIVLCIRSREQSVMGSNTT